MSKVTLDLDIFDTPLKELNLEPPLCVESDLSLHDAVKVMQDKHVGALLCLKNNQLEGIITERDYLMKVLNNIDDLESSSLSNIMTHHPFTLKANEPIRKAMIEMNQHQFRNLPVLGEDGRPLFIVSMKDLVSFILSKLPKDLKNNEDENDIPDHDDLY